VRERDRYTHTQADLDKATVGPDFYLSTRYGMLMNSMMVCLLFSAGIPLLYFVAGLVCFATYAVDKVCECLCVFVCVCVCVCGYVRMHVCMHACMCVCVCVFVCGYVRMYVCMHACISVSVSVSVCVCAQIMLLRIARQPPQFDQSLTKQFLRIIPVGILLHSLWGVWMFSSAGMWPRPPSTHSEKKKANSNAISHRKHT